MKGKVLAFFVLLASLFFLMPALAQNLGQISVAEFSNRLDGVDRMFEFNLNNTSDKDVLLNGRLVVLNVYDISPPSSLPINGVKISAGETTTVSLRWSNAPFFGKIRTLLVLNGETSATIAGAYNFWIFPWQAAIVVLSLALITIGLTFALLRLPEYFRNRKDRVPGNMVAHIVEADDTVVSLANRFDMSWEDIVRANKLKPPYDLDPGDRIFLPKHEIKRPTKEEDDETE